MPARSRRIKATFHLTISMRGQRTTGKIQRNNYHHGSCGPSLTDKTTSVFLIFKQGTHRNVKNRWWEVALIHQQAQVSSFETSYSNPESQTIVSLPKIYWITTAISMVFTKLLLENAFAIPPCNCEVVLKPLLPKAARCIPVLSSRCKEKCAIRVLKRSDKTHSLPCPSMRCIGW